MRPGRGERLGHVWAGRLVYFAHERPEVFSGGGALDGPAPARHAAAIAQRHFHYPGGVKGIRPETTKYAAKVVVSLIAALIRLIQKMDQKGVSASELRVVGGVVTLDECVHQNGVVQDNPM